MTVIAWDGEVLATDTQCTLGNAKYQSPKAWYESVGGQACIISGVGTLKNIHRHKEWLVRDDKSDFPYGALENHYYQFILVTKEGLLRYEGTPYPIVHGVNACAFGEASDFAYGALAMGATAIEAVKVAIQYSHQCGGNVESYSLLKGDGHEKKEN
jgi:hypothetical protein